MKKHLIIFMLLVLAVQLSQAQSLKVGIKAGLNVPSISGDVEETISATTGYHFGGFVRLKPTDKFALQPEILFSNQGFESDDIKNSLNYVNIPVLGRFYLVQGLSIDVGPQIGFLVSAVKGEEDIKDKYKTFDLGVNFGLGLDLPFGLTAGARYYLGLGNINDENPEDFSITNSVFMISLGYAF
ncbi:MAG: porin family protein [Candidatus Cyclobacteriaceae bacterium M3_2C_046]